MTLTRSGANRMVTRWQNRDENTAALKEGYLIYPSQFSGRTALLRNALYIFGVNISPG
jgi:hypothetical protein